MCNSAMCAGHHISESFLRRCRGPYIDLLHKLAKDHMSALKNSATSFTKEQDRELILRFFAMHNNLQNFMPPLSRFLNKEIRENQHMGLPKVQAYAKLFRHTFQLVSRLQHTVASQCACAVLFCHCVFDSHYGPVSTMVLLAEFNNTTASSIMFSKVHNGVKQTSPPSGNSQR